MLITSIVRVSPMGHMIISGTYNKLVPLIFHTEAGTSVGHSFFLVKLPKPSFLKDLGH